MLPTKINTAQGSLFFLRNYPASNAQFLTNALQILKFVHDFSKPKHGFRSTEKS